MLTPASCSSSSTILAKSDCRDCEDSAGMAAKVNVSPVAASPAPQAARAGIARRDEATSAEFRMVRFMMGNPLDGELVRQDSSSSFLRTKLILNHAHTTCLVYCQRLMYKLPGVYQSEFKVAARFPLQCQKTWSSQCQRRQPPPWFEHQDCPRSG